MAEQFFEYIENSPNLQINTSYGSSQNQYPMKTFIQERLATLILSTGTFKVISPDQSFSAPIFKRLFPNDINTRRALQACDLMKTKYIEKKDKKYLEMYWQLRADIQYTNPYSK
jgi:hypothetical protein